MNNALFRTASLYHRVLKIVVGKDGRVPKLRPLAQKRYPHWQSGRLDLVHKKVNDLKHTPRGAHDERTVKYDEALAAAGDLLDLIEAWRADAATAQKET